MSELPSELRLIPQAAPSVDSTQSYRADADDLRGPVGGQQLATRSKEGSHLHGEVEGVPFNDGFISVIAEQILQPHLSRDWTGKVSRSLLLEC